MTNSFQNYVIIANHIMNSFLKVKIFLFVYYVQKCFALGIVNLQNTVI